MNATVSQIRPMKFGELVSWLQQALAGDIDLPRFTSDEPPAVSLARLTPELDGLLQVNVEKACVRLARDFASQPRWSDSGYERQLLSLLGTTRLTEASLPLEKLAMEFPIHLKIEARQRVLHAIHDIGRRHDASFWQRIGKQRPEDFGGIALSALLRLGHCREAFDLLSTFPSRQDLGGVVASLFQLAFRRLSAEDQEQFLASTDSYLNVCKPIIREALRTWLQSRGFRRPRIRTAIAASLRRLVTSDPGPAKLCHRALLPA